MSRVSGPMARVIALFLGSIFAGVGLAPGQTFNSWTNNANALWTTTNFWVPSTNYPDSAGATAYITNNISAARVIYLDTNITLGSLFLGDADTGSEYDLRSTNAATTSITFDSVDSNPALLVHGSGDRPFPNFGNFGNGGDDIDVGINVTDPQGLFIDAFQNLVFNGRAGAIGTEPARAFNGGGYDITKGEDASVFIRTILTNVGTVFVRDGEFRVDMEGHPQLKPGISNIVIGVAPGVVDTGANPLGVVTNTGEGGANDRVQFPMFSIIGANNTNASFAGQIVTNSFDVTINRGHFRSLYRPQTNGVPTVYSGKFTLNGNANEVFIQTENQGFSGNISSVVQQTIFTGPITGSGGFTKIGTGEMTLVGSNDFTGSMSINRPSDSAIGIRGGVRLQEGGTLSGVSQIELNRNGNFFIDNRILSLSNRINDAASLVGRGRSHVEWVGSASEGTYERIGAVTSLTGSLSFEFDKDNATPQSQTLELGSLTRTPGSIINFTASDLRQGVFGFDGPTGIVVNLLDGGASLTRVGSGGGAGTVTQSVAVGVFGGDGVTFNVDPTGTAPNRSDEFMTYDGGRLRTLNPVTEMVGLGGRSTNALNITQASAPTDANVNIDFALTAPALSGGSVVNTNLVDKRVTESATFNSIRFGLVPLLPANDIGRSLVMNDGVTLRSESGMLLIGRDTGSTTGDSNALSNVLLYGGKLDLDGAANNREAIIQNMSGNSFFLRSRLEASQGLTKGGTSRVYLDADNSVGGIVNVAQGELQVRSSGALQGASEIRLNGDGALILSGGISLTNANLRIGPRDTSRTTLFSEGNHNIFGGDILIENVDPQGMILHEVRLMAANNGQNATLTLLGDIGISATNITSDINHIDPQLLAIRDGGGIINFRGTVGDRIVNGEALPIDPAAVGQLRVVGGSITNRASTENQVLRLLIDAPSLASQGDELVVNIEKPWNAAGRIVAAQGTVRFLGDPGLGQGDFWTSNALAVSDFSSGFSGFALGSSFSGGESDRNSSTTFLLTKDGQVFNAERWTVATDNNTSDFTATMGLEHTGPSNATVTIGNNIQDSNPASDDNRITITGGANTNEIREFRLFAHDGYDSATGSNSVGRVNVIQSIRGNDFSMLTVVGNGVVALQNQTNSALDEANQIRNFTLLGGELILDRATATLPADVRRTHENQNPTLVLAGGDVTFLSRSAQTEVFSSNVTVRAGDSRIEVKSQSGVADLAIATGPAAVLTRQSGGTVQFTEDNTAGGTAQIRIAGGVPSSGRIGSWATYGTNLYGGAFTWASTDGSSNVVAFDEASYQEVTSTPGATDHLQVSGDVGFAFDVSAASARFTNAVALDLDGVSLDLVDGGILLTPEVSGGAASIANGSLTSSSRRELIVHNYAVPGGSFDIGASITGAVDVTFSGTGQTLLSTNNSYTGVTRINGGTVQIDNINRLGSVATNLEMRGGTLFTTASTAFTNRTIILGGDGGTFQVASGTTNVLGVVLTESHFLDGQRFNNGHGDLIKTGAGTLELGVNNLATNNFVAGYNMYQGLTDVRAGTLLLSGTNNNVLGSSKSFYDGTIVRGGATLTLGRTPAAFLPAVTNSYSLSEWMIFEQGSTLRVEDPTTGYQSPSINGVVDIRGDTTVFVEGDEFNFNSSGGGYLMGSGDIIKTGGGALRIYENSPDFTGDLRIWQGNVQDLGFRNSALPNLGRIILGTNGGTAGVSFTVRPERDAIAGETTINADIEAYGFGDTRLTVRRAQHNDVVRYKGDIDLTGWGSNGYTAREFLFEIQDSVDTRDVGGSTEYREELFMALEGNITAGDKRLRTLVTQEGTGNRDLGNQSLSNQFDIFAFFDFRGSNAGWTGSLEVGNRQADNDLDRRHFVRFGNNDGLASLAIGASNNVVLRHDATLQAHGGQVTIGNLFSDGNSGNDGYFGQELVTNTFLENGGTVAGSFTINQTSNRTFNGVIRDGTYYSPTTTNLAAAALSIVKAGSGILTLDQSNYYSGATIVQAGELRVNGSHIGGGLYGVLPGGTLGGTGLIQSAGVIIGDGGILAPGNSPGTLRIDSDLVFSNAAVLRFELNATNMVAGLGINDLVTDVNNLALDGILNVTWTGDITNNANSGDYWALIQYDGALSDLGVDLSSLPDISGLGLTWYIDTTTVANQVGLAVVIPEPSTWALMMLGLGLVGCIARRRRR